MLCGCTCIIVMMSHNCVHFVFIVCFKKVYFKLIIQQTFNIIRCEVDFLCMFSVFTDS